MKGVVRDKVYIPWSEFNVEELILIVDTIQDEKKRYMFSITNKKLLRSCLKVVSGDIVDFRVDDRDNLISVSIDPVSIINVLRR